MSISLNKEKIKTYAVSILVPLVLGAIVGVLTTRTMHYENLNKPFLAPPAILFRSCSSHSNGACSPSSGSSCSMSSSSS